MRIFVLLFVFLIGCCHIGLTQKNRFETYFKKVDSLKQEEQIKSLINLEKTNRLNTTEKVQFYKRIIPATIETQKYDLALQHCFEAEKLAKKLKNDTLVCYFINQIGGTYYYIGNKQKAIDYFLKSYLIAEKRHFWEIAAMTSSNLGALYIETSNYAEAEQKLKRSIEIFKAHKTDKKQGLLPYRLLATLYSQQKEYDKARPIFEENIVMARLNKDTSMICSSLMYYGMFLSDIGQHSEGIKKLEESLALEELLNDKVSLASNLSLLGQLYATNKEFSKAYKALIEVIKYNKEIFQDNLKTGIAETEVKYKTAEIKQQKELAEAKTKAEKRKNNLYLTIFLSILLIVLITFLLIYFRQQAKRRKIELNLQRELIESVVKAQEDEKMRIARDLHDGICQKFAATKMKFSAINSELNSIDSLNEKYASALSLLDEATNELRGISHEIMPPTLYEHDLIGSIKSLTINAFPEQIDSTFEVFGTPFQLSENENINVYRIVQELLANIMKHAKATQVSVQLIYSNEGLNLMIEDNGVGMNNRKTEGIGLKNMKLRAEIIKAKLEITSGANNGTISTLTLEKKS